MDKPLKILFVSAVDDPKDGAGAERTTQTLMYALKAEGHDIAIASTSDVAGIHRHDRDGIRVWRAGTKNVYWPQRGAKQSPSKRRLFHIFDSYNWLMRKQLEIIIEAERPDIVSLHNLPAWSIAAVDAVKAKGVPSVQVLHDYYYACATAMLFKSDKNCIKQCKECRFLRLPHRKASNLASAVVGVSDYTLNRLLNMQFFEKVPIKRVIHNSRSPKSLRLDERPTYGPNGRPLGDKVAVRFGFIGTLAPSKGIELLIKSFNDLTVDGSQLFIAGSGDSHYVRHLNLSFASENVIFLGQVDPFSFFSEIDILIVPSLWQEPLAMVIVESFSFGVPVVASERGGIPEIVRDGINGFLFDPDQPDGLAKVLQEIVANPSKISDLSAQAFVDSKPFLDPQGWANKYVALYRDILSRNKVLTI